MHGIGFLGKSWGACGRGREAYRNSILHQAKQSSGVARGISSYCSGSDVGRKYALESMKLLSAISKRNE
jgi:hypothetical protein